MLLPAFFPEIFFRQTINGFPPRSISSKGTENITTRMVQTSHMRNTAILAFFVVFHVKYFKSRYTARNLSSMSTVMETRLSRESSKLSELEIMAQVFPVNQLVCRTKYITNSGTLTSALRKSIRARLMKRMFGKLRNTLKRGKIAMNDPLPNTEMNDRVTARKIMAA